LDTEPGIVGSRLDRNRIQAGRTMARPPSQTREALRYMIKTDYGKCGAVPSARYSLRRCKGLSSGFFRVIAERRVDTAAILHYLVVLHPDF
jgi:hypothetical protein